MVDRLSTKSLLNVLSDRQPVDMKSLYGKILPLRIALQSYIILFTKHTHGKSNNHTPPDLIFDIRRKHLNSFAHIPEKSAILVYDISTHRKSRSFGNEICKSTFFSLFDIFAEQELFSRLSKSLAIFCDPFIAIKLL